MTREPRERLSAFKDRLRWQHTVGNFSTPRDLAEKLSRDFKERFFPSEPQKDDAKPEEDVFAKTVRALKAFRLTPKRYNGTEVRLCVSFDAEIFPASRLFGPAALEEI